MQYHREGNRPDMSAFCLDKEDETTVAVVELINECWQEEPSQRPEFKEVCTRLKAIRKAALALPEPSGAMSQPRLSASSTRNPSNNLLKAPFKESTLVGARVSAGAHQLRADSKIMGSGQLPASFQSGDQRSSSDWLQIAEHDAGVVRSDERTVASVSASSNMVRTQDVIAAGANKEALHSSPKESARGAVAGMRQRKDGPVIVNGERAGWDEEGQTWKFPIALYHELTWQIYGYTMAISVLTVVYIGVLSLVPWTKQPSPSSSTAASVPSYDRTLYVFAFLPLIMVLGVTVNWAMSSSFSNPVFGDEPYMEWRFGLVGGIPATVFFGLFLHTAILGLPFGVGGIDPCYGLLDAVLVIPFTLSAIPIFKAASAVAYDYRLDRYLLGEWKSDATVGVAQDEDQSKDDDDDDDDDDAAVAVIEQKVTDASEPSGKNGHAAGEDEGGAGSDNGEGKKNNGASFAAQAIGVGVISM